MCGTNLETSHVVPSSTVVIVHAAALSVIRDRLKGCKFVLFDPLERASLCGFTTRTSRTHYIVCTHRAVKALQIAGLSLLASRVMTEHELEFENLTHFSFLSLSPEHAVMKSVASHDLVGYD